MTGKSATLGSSEDDFWLEAWLESYKEPIEGKPLGLDEFSELWTDARRIGTWVLYSEPFEGSRILYRWLRGVSGIFEELERRERIKTMRAEQDSLDEYDRKWASEYDLDAPLIWCLED